MKADNTGMLKFTIWLVLTYFGMKCKRISVEASFDRAQSVNLMIEVVSTAAAVASVAELAIRKTVAVSEMKSIEAVLLVFCKTRNTILGPD